MPFVTIEGVRPLEFFDTFPARKEIIETLSNAMDSKPAYFAVRFKFDLNPHTANGHMLGEIKSRSFINKSDNECGAIAMSIIPVLKKYFPETNRHWLLQPINRLMSTIFKKRKRITWEVGTVEIRTFQ